MATKAENTIVAAQVRAARKASSRSWLVPLTRTEATVVPFVLRLTLAAVFFPHGAQKLLGWFGGAGFDGSMAMLTGYYGLPAIVAFAVIMIEFFAPLLLALGAASRLAAVGIVAVMTGAVASDHWANGFFMNWSGTQAGEGFEFHLLAIGMAAAVIIAGSGIFSLDRRLGRGGEGTA